MRGETFWCPRRMPGVTRFGPDRWETDRWTKDHTAAQAERDAYAEEHPNGSCSPVMGEWIWDGDVPRTCSYCGGVHPEDAIRLVEQGWEVETTGKHYKRYLSPPGYAANHEMLMDSLRQRAAGERTDRPEGLPGYREPVPPVKLYTPHFREQQQVDRFNAALRAQGEELSHG